MEEIKSSRKEMPAETHKAYSEPIYIKIKSFKVQYTGEQPITQQKHSVHQSKKLISTKNHYN